MLHARRGSSNINIRLALCEASSRYHSGALGRNQTWALPKQFRWNIPCHGRLYNFYLGTGIQNIASRTGQLRCQLSKYQRPISSSREFWNSLYFPYNPTITSSASSNSVHHSWESFISCKDRAALKAVSLEKFVRVFPLLRNFGSQPQKVGPSTKMVWRRSQKLLPKPPVSLRMCWNAFIFNHRHQ